MPFELSKHDIYLILRVFDGEDKTDTAEESALYLEVKNKLQREFAVQSAVENVPAEGVEMTAKELAHDLYRGFRDAYHCPDVCITEYEGAIAYRIQKAIDASVNEDRSRGRS